MFSIISGLLGILPTISNTINGITQAIANERIASINATTEQDKINTEERIKSLEAKRDVLVAEIGHSNWDLIIRVLLSLGPTVYFGKLFIWDKVFNLGSTEPLSPDMVTVSTAVIGFYFLYSGAMGVTRLIKS